MPNSCLLNPEQECYGLLKAKEIEEEMQDMRDRNDKSHKEFFDRLALLEAHNKVQDAHYAHIIEKLTDITNKLSSLSDRIAVIEHKPGKRWDGMVEKAIGLVVAAVIGYILANAGL